MTVKRDQLGFQCWKNFWYIIGIHFYVYCIGVGVGFWCSAWGGRWNSKFFLILYLDRDQYVFWGMERWCSLMFMDTRTIFQISKVHQVPSVSTFYCTITPPKHAYCIQYRNVIYHWGITICILYFYMRVNATIKSKNGCQRPLLQPYQLSSAGLAHVNIKFLAQEFFMSTGYGWP